MSCRSTRPASCRSRTPTTARPRARSTPQPRRSGPPCVTSAPSRSASSALALLGARHLELIEDGDGAFRGADACDGVPSGFGDPDVAVGACCDAQGQAVDIEHAAEVVVHLAGRADAPDVARTGRGEPQVTVGSRRDVLGLGRAYLELAHLAGRGDASDLARRFLREPEISVGSGGDALRTAALCDAGGELGDL